MNTRLLLTLASLCSRQRLLLVLSVVLVLGIVLFNSVASAVDVSGWSSGFTHPLHGGDHFLTMLAVGIWAAQLRGKAIWLLPVTFVGVMSLGGIAGAAGLFIPSAELIILLSGLVFSVFIVRKIRFSSQTNVIIVAFFAFFHGFAHGQEISTSASLISYTLGFMLATLLLHGAGILIVRLLVVIFALFISHLAYAQSSINHLVIKVSVATTHADKTHEFFTAASPAPAPPDQQLFYNGEDGGGGQIKCDERQSESCCHPRQGGCEFVRAIHQASNNIAYTVAAAWLLSPQISIHFLTNGVGKTSPPAAWMSDSTSHFCSAAVLAHHSNSIVTPPIDLLPAFHTLATSFLTNGVGATSPPVWRVSSTALTIHESVFDNSTRFKRSTPLLLSSTSVLSKTRFKSRSPPFACFSLTNSLGHSALPIV